MIIDTHSHLNFNAYKNDLDEVIKRTLDENIWMINVGSKYETSRQAVEIAEKYETGVYSAIGLHPIFSGAEFIKIKTDPEEGEFLVEEQDFDKKKYKVLARSQKVVAIGEIGLDYYYRPKTQTKLEQFKEKQKQVFIQQLKLAEELDLPVILHCRMAHTDTLDILKSQIPNPNDQKNPKLQNPKLRGVIHCFTGNLDEMREYLDLGFFIGLNGIIFKLDLDEVIKSCPLDKILTETDCPYLTPPMAPKKRNEPIFIKHVVQKIAGLKGISFQEVAGKTTQNAKNLFNI